MHPIKLEFMNTITEEARSLISQDANYFANNKLTDEQLQELVFKVVLSIPERFIYLSDSSKLNYAIKLIASEIVLFQAVDHLDDAHYPICFTNFIIELNNKLL